MATAHQNLSNYNREEIPNGADFKIGIVVSEWNGEITNNLLQGALQLLRDCGVKDQNIHVKAVPGAFELPLASQFFCEKEEIDGVIAIGVVIQGETKHFDFVCEGATHGIMNVGLKYNKPVAFCVLTDNHIQQSIDRSGGKHGNKGIECALACVKMIALKKEMK